MDISPSSMRLIPLILGSLATAVGPASSLPAAIGPRPVGAFLDRYCLDCHDGETKKGGLDLESLSLNPEDPRTFTTWVLVHDRVRNGEMPPKKKSQPAPAEKLSFLDALAAPLMASDHARIARDGRAAWRRMNRYEYENTLRDLLGIPWLQIKDMLPEDGEAHRFNKVGDALDVSHVQISRYLTAADYALREVLIANTSPPSHVTRFYARDQRAFARRVKYTEFNRSPERATFPIIDNEADLPALEGTGPMTVGEADPDIREREAMGVVASTYEPLEIKFDGFKAQTAGRYRLRFNAHTFWAGPESPQRWWRPSRSQLSAGRSREPVSVYAETPPRLLRKLGVFEVFPEPAIHELEVYLLAGETIRPDAVRLFRSRPPGPWQNPLAEKDGQPGVAFRWLEVEGPLNEPAIKTGLSLLFDELPVARNADGTLSVASHDITHDAQRLLERFTQRAWRRPVPTSEIHRFIPVIHKALASGSSFADAMIAGYSAVLCSPGFVTLEERPGPLDDYALATRLSYFLWNSEPDAELRHLATTGRLREPSTLRAQAHRLLNDAKSHRFVHAFLDYWLDLRHAGATSPDAALYPDYYLDDYLVESAVDESRAFFHELLKANLPARNIIHSDFIFANERLAGHYGIPGVQGITMRPVPLPKESPRGGFLTQASVLKVTANGTTTSPVLRGVWILERILGVHVPPPPSAVPAVEPDTRGTTTIREQLEKHRTLESCNSCHVKIDPPGFALESFDILGGWQTHYRALSDEKPTQLTARAFGKNGQPFEFHDGPPVDPAGMLPDGRSFSNVRELKQLLLENERQIARSIASHLIVFATGAPVGFADRPALEGILDRTASNAFGLRSLVEEIVASELFCSK
jgi:hypothetical protein